MSINFRTALKIPFHELFDGRLEHHGVREITVKDTSEETRLLTDGQSCIWAYRAPDGSLCILRRYAGNSSHKFIRAISQEFETEIYAESQPQYYGFETDEEMDIFFAKLSEERRVRDWLLRILRPISNLWKKLFPPPLDVGEPF